MVTTKWASHLDRGDVNAAGICSSIRFRTWEKEKSQRWLRHLVWAIGKIRVLIYRDGKECKLFHSLIFVPRPCPWICYTSSKDNRSFTFSLHSPSFLSFEKPKSSCNSEYEQRNEWYVLSTWLLSNILQTEYKYVCLCELAFVVVA